MNRESAIEVFRPSAPLQMPDELVARLVKREDMGGLEALGEELTKRISPPGQLGFPLPDLLEKRRIQWRMPDAMFTRQALFDRVLIFQLPTVALMRVAMGESVLFTEDRKDYERKTSPLGIVMSAGPKALDELRSNGVDIGHIVEIAENVPRRVVVDIIGGKDVELLMIRAGDICSSVDLNVALADGSCKIERRETVDGKWQHLYVDAEGKEWKPQNPWYGADD